MIFIPGNVPSVKNSKNPFTVNGRTVLTPSRTVKKYLQNIGVKSYGRKGFEEYKTRSNKFRLSVNKYFDNCPQPVIVGFHFVRGSRRKFDFHNAVQIIADLLTSHDFIEDDNMDCFIPVPFEMNGKWYSIDKETPGVFLQRMDKEIK